MFSLSKLAHFQLQGLKSGAQCWRARPGDDMSSLDLGLHDMAENLQTITVTGLDHKTSGVPVQTQTAELGHRLLGGPGTRQLQG